METWTAIAAHIAAATDRPFTVTGHRPVGGGCINTAYILTDGRTSYFVKLNGADKEPMFAAELAGLREIEQSGAVRVPSPVCCGTAGGHAYIVMEHLELGRGGNEGETLGRRLAAMHRTTRPTYGWDRDNTIGSTPQPNDPGEDWTEFWRDRRIGFQLRLAARQGYGGRLQERGEQLLEALPVLLAGHRPPASLLHGDLWSGNYASVAGDGPVIFDPAVYFGDRETDMAMTELFGGFPARFYQAYDEAYPLPAEYREVRKPLYNLYHVLNHLNLFGGGYGGQAETMIDRLLSEAR